MEKNVITKIKADPDFQRLVKKRARYAWGLSAAMLTAYYSFIMLVAFFPEIISMKLFEDKLITLGIPLGVGLILFAFLLTGIYVYKANTEFDILSNNVLEHIE